jgi:hypothetical protein
MLTLNNRFRLSGNLELLKFIYNMIYGVLNMIELEYIVMKSRQFTRTILQAKLENGWYVINKSSEMLNRFSQN